MSKNFAVKNGVYEQLEVVMGRTGIKNHSDLIAHILSRAYPEGILNKTGKDLKPTPLEFKHEMDRILNEAKHTVDAFVQSV